MSITFDVCRQIERKGGATLDELVADLGYTREQVKNVLKNARSAGLIHTLGWQSRTGKGTGAGRAQSAYYSGPRPEGDVKPVKAPPRIINARPPASVWELAHGLQIAGEWPPVFQGGRVNVLHDEAEAA